LGGARIRKNAASKWSASNERGLLFEDLLRGLHYMTVTLRVKRSIGLPSKTTTSDINAARTRRGLFNVLDGDFLGGSARKHARAF